MPRAAWNDDLIQAVLEAKEHIQTLNLIMQKKKMSMTVIFIALAIIVGGTYYALQPKSAKASNDVTAEQIKAMMNDPNVVMLDVRTPMEVSGGKIGNAVHVDYMNRSFENQIAKLDPSKTYVVYCHSAGRSPGAVRTLKKNGFQNVLHYPGGWADWSRKN